MAELATIARPYAQALFLSLNADAKGESVWLDEIAQIAANSSVQEFAANPVATDAQVFELIRGLLKSALSTKAENFLHTVIANGRLSAFPAIAAQFHALKNAQNGVSDAIVYSAFAMTESDVGAVAAVLEKRFSRKLNVTMQMQADLIAGIRVVVGDEVLDTSVKARLEQMKVALTT